jgi:hypothetical protein
MRDGIGWIFALVALPAVAAADDVETVASLGGLADAASASAGGEAAAAPAGLDLQIDQLPLPAPAAPHAARAIAPSTPERYTGAEPQAAERGLSVGLELRRYRWADHIARVAEPDEPGLQDNVERLIDRSALGLRGRYRF